MVAPNEEARIESTKNQIRRKKKEMRIASHYYQYPITLPITLHRQINPL